MSARGLMARRSPNPDDCIISQVLLALRGWTKHRCGSGELERHITGDVYSCAVIIESLHYRADRVGG